MEEQKSTSLFKKFFSLYSDGFRNLPGWAKKVWLIILIKAFIMLVILKLIFFPNFLRKNFSNDEQRSNHVIQQLTNP